MSTNIAPIVTDGEKLTCATRLHELFTRFTKGVYANPSEVLDGLQLLIEGKSLKVVPTVAPVVQALTVATGDTWEVRDGVIYVTLPASEGVTGPQWINRLNDKGYHLSDDAIGLLESKDFKRTTGVVHKLAILTAKFWSDSERYTRTIRPEGQGRKWIELNPEAICILRESFSDEDLEKMGFLWIVGVHEPIEVRGSPRWLRVGRSDDGGWLGTGWARPDDFWHVDGAFAWSLSQENQS
jgi:hypothetical protein